MNQLVRGFAALTLAIVIGACRGRREEPGTGAGGAAAATPSASSPSASATGTGSAVASAAGDELTRALAEVEAAGSAAPTGAASAQRVEKLIATIVAPKVPDASDALAKGKWRFRGCALAALAEPVGDAGVVAHVEGSFTFELLFDGDGRVATAKPKGGTKPPPPASRALEACLATALGKIAFASPTEEGARGEVSISLRASRAPNASNAASASNAPSASGDARAP